jgi:hypothetical protein
MSVLRNRQHRKIMSVLRNRQHRKIMSVLRNQQHRKIMSVLRNQQHRKIMSVLRNQQHRKIMLVLRNRQHRKIMLVLRNRQHDTTYSGGLASTNQYNFMARSQKFYTKVVFLPIFCEFCEQIYFFLWELLDYAPNNSFLLNSKALLHH